MIYDIEFQKNELDVIVKIASELCVSPSEDAELFCKSAKLLSDKIPQRIKNILIDFAKYGNKKGFIIIKINLNDILLDNNNILPPTPDNNNSKIGEKTIFAGIQAILIHVISEMIAYEAEGYGRLFQDVIPIKKMESEQTSVGSNTELEIHTEQAFSKLRPDILSLACIRGDVNAKTYILPVNIILDILSEYEKILLRKPLWKIGVDLSFKLHGKQFLDGEIRGPISIINGSQDDPILIFDQDLMFGITEEANQLIKKIVEIYYNHRFQHNLNAGELILIDNKRAVHGRSAFIPKYDGKDRFLIRCFSVFDYEKSNYARINTRVVSAIYS
jgi:L-asparagine oxygenase